jgi:LPS O-antigen subunit length determinant protein (WzzB/FepE family)
MGLILGALLGGLLGMVFIFVRQWWRDNKSIITAE